MRRKAEREVKAIEVLRTSAGFSSLEYRSPDETEQPLSEPFKVPRPPVSVRSLLRKAKKTTNYTPRWAETQWETTVRNYHDEMERVEKLDRAASQAKGKKRDELLVRLNRSETKCQDIADVLFGLFGIFLGVRGLTGYRKPEFDDAMETCFGSLNVDGTGVFQLRTKTGLRSIKVGDDPREANRVFSLYLARKVLCPVSVKKKNSALEKFYETVCSPPPCEVSGAMMAYFEEVVRLIFDKPDPELRDTCFPVPATACAESTVRQGGKRQYYYLNQEKSFDRGKVTPVAIYTGGKVRVITVDSSWNMRYAFLNKYMADKIRQARWCVFGRSVGEWLEQNPEFLETAENEEYVSGDLESATDLLHPSFANFVLEHLGRLWNLQEWEVQEMKAFTTEAVLEDMFHSERQKRGQLMGSVLSFPILCLVSFCFATFDTELSEKLMRPWRGPSKRSDRRKLVMEYSGCGINGDDVVSKETDRGERWRRNVSDGSGKVSPGKSLRSRNFFTVNSECWVRDANGDWHPPASIRPSLLCAMAGKKRKNPAMEWLEYSRSDLISQEGKDYFRIDRVLKPHIPKAFGGLGLVNRWDPYGFLEAWIAKKEIRESKETIRPSAFWAGYIHPFAGVRKVEVLVPRDEVSDITELLFESKLPQWTVGGYTDVLERAAALTARQYAHMTDGEKASLKVEYEYQMGLDREGLKAMKVPVSMARIWGGQSMRSSFRGARMTGVGLKDLEREATIDEAIGVSSQRDWAYGLDGLLEHKLKIASWTWLERKNEEMRVRRNGLPDFLQVPQHTPYYTLTSKRSVRNAATLARAEHEPEPKVDLSSGRLSCDLVFPAGYDEKPFSPRLTEVEQWHMRRGRNLDGTEKERPGRGLIGTSKEVNTPTIGVFDGGLESNQEDLLIEESLQAMLEDMRFGELGDDELLRSR